MRRTIGEHLLGPLGFLIAGALGFALVASVDPWLRNAEPDAQVEPTSIADLRTYTPGSCNIIGCGMAPVPGWEGCSGARGMTYEGSDGSTLLLMEDECTSYNASRERLEELLDPGSGIAMPGTTVTEQSVDVGILLEFSTPIDAGLVCRPSQPVRCAVANVGASGLRMLYGPDAEHTLQLARQLGWR